MINKRIPVEIPGWLQAVVSVITLSVVLRLLFSVGYGYDVNLSDLRALWEFAEGFREDFPATIRRDFSALHDSIGLSRAIQYFPLVISFVFVGFSKTAVSSFSILSSIAGSVGLYLLLTLFFDRRIALAALFLWTINPLEGFSAGIIAPNAFLMMLVIIATLLFIYSEKTKNPFGSLVGIILLLFVASGQPLLASVYFLLFLYRRAARHVAFQPFLGILIVGFGIWVLLVLPAGDSAPSALDFYAILLEQPEALLLLPILLLAVAVPLINGTDLPRFLIAWLALSTAAAFINEILYSDSIESRFLYLLNLSLPVLVLGAHYFVGGVVEKRFNRGMIIASAILGLGAWLGLLGQREFIGPYAFEQFTSLASLFPLYRLFAGLFLIGCFLSPLLFRLSSGTKRTTLVLGLLTILGFSFFPMLEARVDDFRYRMIANRGMIALLQQQTMELPLLVQSSQMKLLIDYEVDFDWLSLAKDQGFALAEVQRMPSNLKLIEEAYIILEDDFTSQEIPNGWLRIGTAGELGQRRWVLYRSLLLSDVSREKAELLASTGSSRSVEIYERLYEINANLGLACESAWAWINARRFSTQEMSYIPTNVSTRCFDGRLGGDLLEGTEEVGTVYDYLVVVTTRDNDDPDIDAQQYRQIFHKHLFFDDPRAVNITVPMEPASFYLYEVTLRTQRPTMALYWDDGMNRDYLEKRTYPEWERLVILLATPDWEGRSKEVYLAPVLFDHLGFVDLLDWHLWELSLP